jgi:hypothetical protein
MNNDDVKIELTKDEALVLFEFLQRFSENDELVIEHQSEERALWNLTCVLEKALSEPFRADYSKILESARERLRDEE